MTDYYQTGDTIRLQAVFSTFAGVVSDLSSNPTLKIYDHNLVVLTTIAGSSLTKPSTGTYYYDYTLPSTAGTYYYEFSGTVESTIILRRGVIVVAFYR